MINTQASKSFGARLAGTAVAAASGHTDVVRLLLERGADVHVQARDVDRGFATGTALTEAMQRGHTGIAALLREAGAEETG